MHAEAPGRYRRPDFPLQFVRFIYLLGFLLLSVLTPNPVAAQSASSETKQVLVLYGERLDLPAIRDVELGIREIFSTSPSPPIEWYAEHFDFARFPYENHNAILARYLRDRYAERKLDLVMAVSSQTLAFTLNYRAQCFPGVPVVFAVRTSEAMDTRSLPPDVTGLALKSHLKESVELALTLQPDAKEIVVIAGSGESGTLAHAGQVLDHYRGRVSWRMITDLPTEELITEALRVRRGDILLLLSVMKDSAGRALSTSEMARRIAADSAAPVYGVGTGMIDTGAVGGALTDFRGAGRRAANMALRVLAGETVPVDMDESRTLTPLTVDWRALRHWNLVESRIPAEAVVMFRQPTLWEEHRGLVLGVAAVLAIQMALIAALLAQRARRRRLEREAEKLRHELAHAGRVTMLGQLAVSLAHELNQPLNSILRNAEAAELFLENDAPDVTELRPIIADILMDDQRARDVIDHLRAFLKRSEANPQPLSLGEVVEEITALTKVDAVARRMEIELSIPKDLPRVICDRVQFQQVLLNLLLNAMDALADSPVGDKRIAIEAVLNGAGMIEVAVHDNGPGFPNGELPRLFEPFFTTKTQGLGMGLPISRTIVEAHGGRLWAENNAARGATFRFTLPAAKGGAP